jgi:hypothetical protein
MRAKKKHTPRTFYNGYYLCKPQSDYAPSRRAQTPSTVRGNRRHAKKPDRTKMPYLLRCSFRSSVRKSRVSSWDMLSTTTGDGSTFCRSEHSMRHHPERHRYFKDKGRVFPHQKTQVGDVSRINSLYSTNRDVQQTLLRARRKTTRGQELHATHTPIFIRVAAFHIGLRGVQHPARPPTCRVQRRLELREVESMVTVAVKILQTALHRN